MLVRRLDRVISFFLPFSLIMYASMCNTVTPTLSSRARPSCEHLWQESLLSSLCSMTSILMTPCILPSHAISYAVKPLISPLSAIRSRDCDEKRTLGQWKRTNADSLMVYAVQHTLHSNEDKVRIMSRTKSLSQCLCCKILSKPLSTMLPVWSSQYRNYESKLCLVRC